MFENRTAGTGALKKGFTLIELLVVIAIISILAAILFPVFAQARESARRTSCVSNLKQMGLATMQHIQDYDEYYPSFNSFWGGPVGGQPGGQWGNATTIFWPQTLFPYHKSLQVFKCPSSSTLQVNSNPTNMVRGNYGANTEVFGSSASPVHQAVIVSVAKTYMILDAGYYTMDPNLVKSTYVPSTASNRPYYIRPLA